MYCPHLNPKGYPEIHTEEQLSRICKEERRWNIMWGVVHPGHAYCVYVAETKKKAEEYKKARASAYVVVKVCVTPLYQSPD